MSQASTNLVLLPGLGADHRIFESQRRAFPGLRIVERTDPAPRESLSAYAARLVERFSEPGTPYVLGGSSMGGMVALEMARHLRPAALVLIGSASSGREVRGWLRAVERLARPLPDVAIAAGRSLAPIGAPLFSSASRVNRRLFLEMLADTPTSFLRWASRAVVEWRPASLPDIPIHRLHGTRDTIIRPAEDATLLAGAGHLVNLSHPGATNAWLRGVLAPIARSSP